MEGMTLTGYHYKKCRSFTYFLVWKFWRKAQFSHSFGRITRNYVKTVTLHKIFASGNYVKLRYFYAVQNSSDDLDLLKNS